MHLQKNPFLDDRSFQIHEWQPDIDKMNNCIQQLLGEHDFSTFEKKGSDNKTSICLLEDANGAYRRWIGVYDNRQSVFRATWCVVLRRHY